MSDEIDLSDKLYTTTEVAKIFRVRPATVNNWVKRGLFGVDEDGNSRVHFTAGGHARIPHSVIMDLYKIKADQPKMAQSV